MSRQAAQTALGPMVIAAVERTFPANQRILDDPFARKVLPFSGRLAAGLMGAPAFRGMMIRRMEQDYPGLWAWMACRKRYIDDKIAERAAEIEAVVNLGAGFDTRSLRLAAIRALPIWEVDQPENIAAKRRALARQSGGARSNLKLVAVDFDREDLGVVLSRQGYSLDRKTFFIWEGVTQYVAEPGITDTLKFLARAASGSALAFTYVDKALLSGPKWPGAELLYKRFVATGIWRFGIEPQGLAAMLNPYGWRPVEEVGPEDLFARYVAPTGRRVKTAPPIEHLVLATKL